MQSKPVELIVRLVIHTTPETPEGTSAAIDSVEFASDVTKPITTVAAESATPDGTVSLLSRLLGALTDQELTDVANNYACADRLGAFMSWSSMPVQVVSGITVQVLARSILARRAAQSSVAPQVGEPVASPSGGSHE